MKIEILTSDGSPLGVSTKTVWGDEWQVGVGGAELALLTMCEEWTKAGHEVILYNNPRETVSPFEQRRIDDFDPQSDRDVLITFRSPNPKSIIAKGLKVWWSTDQYTRGDFGKFAPSMDKIVCISDFHADHFQTAYGIENTIVIDLPVRLDDYLQKAPISKIKNRVIFTSVPDRGLQNLWRIWPIIKRSITDATLVITSDYRLWGGAGGVQGNAGNELHKVRWVVHDGIEFKGAMPRSEFIVEEMMAEFFVYPCNYDELFCISCAEAQVVGAYPITTNQGSLKTTNMGTQLALNSNDPRNDIVFAGEVIEIMQDEHGTSLLREKLIDESTERFAPGKILEDWDEKVFT